MLDYTKAAIMQTFADLKKGAWWLKAGTQIVYIAYLIYALISSAGVFYANVALLAISTGYLFFFLFTTSFGKSPDGKQMQKTVRTVYVWVKRAITLFTLGVAIYALVSTTKHLTVTDLLFTALMIVGWVLGVAFELIIKVVQNRVQLITEALEADIEQVTKPVRAVGNFFKKVAGKEVEPQKEPSKNRIFLDKKVAEKKAEEKRKKEEARRLKRQARKPSFDQSIGQKQDAKRLKRQPKEPKQLPTSTPSAPLQKGKKRKWGKAEIVQDSAPLLLSETIENNN